MAETENILEIQRALVNAERAKRIAEERKNARDIRSRIGRSGWYNPEADDNDPSRHSEYPKWVNGKLVASKHDENALLGIKEPEAKVVEVDVAALAQEPEQPRQKRKYIRKAPPAELPPDLG